MADAIISSGGTGTFPYYDYDVCNMALSKIGNADNFVTATTLLNNSTKEDRLCNLHYFHVLNLVLSRLPWECTIVRDTLDVDDEVEVKFGFEYQYELPSDCLIIDKVSDDPDFGNPHFEWKKEGSYILCNSEEHIYISYVSSDKTTDEQNTQFLELLVAFLAYRIAPSLEIGRSGMARLKNDLDDALLFCTVQEAKQEYVDESKSLWEDAGRKGSYPSQFAPAVYDGSKY